MIIVDPVNAASTFFSYAEGCPLISVVIFTLRQVLIPFHQTDLENPPLKKMRAQSLKFWNTAGAYADPSSFR